MATLSTALTNAIVELMVQLDAEASIETPGWLERMVRYYGLGERVRVVCGRVLLDKGRAPSVS